MARPVPQAREGIDPAWLAAAAEREPVVHAYALWDVERAPESTRFVTFEGADARRSYLLIWLGEPSAPVVHWVGDAPDDLPLVRSIPPDASLAVVPERAGPAVRARFAPTNEEPLLIMARPRTDPLPKGQGRSATRLGPTHAEALREFAERFPETLTRAYRTIDLELERAWGSFEGPELVGVARVTVALPRIWIVSGVYVAPGARGAGHGRALTEAATAAAHAAGAAAGLFVREHNAAALGLYRRLGYRTVARRVLFEFPKAGTAVYAAR